MAAITVNELLGELEEPFQAGIRRGHRKTLDDARFTEEYLGYDPDAERARQIYPRVTPMDPRTLGTTSLNPQTGRAEDVAINPYIKNISAQIGLAYGKTVEWMKRLAGVIAEDTTHHEGVHVLSGRLSRKENIDGKARSLMESITTFGRYLIALKRGDYARAEWIKETNPYKPAWLMGELAEKVYQSDSGYGYRAFLKDAQNTKFYKVIGRLAWQALRAGYKDTIEKISMSDAKYAPA